MTIDFLPQLAFSFLLIFARVAMIATLIPTIGSQSVPSRVRLTIALLITLVLVPLVSDVIPEIPTSIIGLASLIVGEIIIGFFIGGTASMLAAALETAGTSIAFQTSLSAAQNTNVQTQVQGTLVASFLSIVSVALVFALNIHHLAIAAMHDSYTLFRPGNLMPVGDMTTAAVTLFADSFKLGIQISAPFIVIGFVFNVGVGLLSRLMPQFQVFLVLLPANLMIGFVAMAVLLGTMMMWYAEHLRNGLSIFLVN